ncbi:hypothetical protein D3C86_1895660 [compost metagenome]
MGCSLFTSRKKKEKGPRLVFTVTMVASGPAAFFVPSISRIMRAGPELLSAKFCFFTLPFPLAMAIFTSVAFNT